MFSSSIPILAAFLAFIHPGIAIAASLTLQESVEVALQENSDVQAAEAEIAAARARLAGASLLLRGNPEIRSTAGSRSNDGSDSVEWSVEVTQAIEVGGQRSARVRVADSGLRRAEAQLANRRTQVAAATRIAFGRASKARALTVLSETTIELARKSVEAAQERYRAGSASLIEVNSAVVELARVQRDALVAQTAATEEVAELRSLLGLPMTEPLVLRDGTYPRASSTRLEDLRQLALHQRGDLLEAEAALAEVKAESALAAREAVVTPSFGVAYSREEGANVVQGVVSVPLPLFDRNQAAKGVAGARVVQAAAALKAARLRIDIDLELAMARLRSASLIAESVTGAALQAARENRDLADEGYRAGKIDFLQLLIVRRDAVEAERAAIESMEAVNTAEAELARATGSVW